MKRMTKIALLALMAGGAVSLASTNIATARGMGPGGPGGAGGPQGMFLRAEFADVDVTGDGLITVEDLRAQADERFAGADADGNGLLSQDELKAAIEARMTERMAMRQERAEAQGGDAQGPRWGRYGGDGPDMSKRLGWMVERIIERGDSDGDGALSQDEVVATEKMDRLIDRFDTDDDNALSAEEFDQAQKEAWLRMQQRRGAQRPGGPGRN